MAIKSQLIAAALVAILTSAAAAQQYGPPMGNGYGPDPGLPPQMAAQQMPPQMLPPQMQQPMPPQQMMTQQMMPGPGSAPFAAPAGMPQPFDGPQGTPMMMGAGMQPDQIQMVSATSAGPPAAPPQQTMPGPAPPNGAMMATDPNGYPQGGGYPGGPDGGMPCGPGGPGYPGMQPGPNGYGCGQFPAPEPKTPRWYFRGEAVWLTRNNPNDRNLTSYNNTSNTSDKLNNRFLFNTDDATFDLTSGMRLTLGHYITDRTAIEGAFYGTNRWEASNGTQQFPSSNGLGPLSPYWGNGGGPFSTAAFSNSNQQVATYYTTFDSAELGVRQWLTPNMSALLGFRFINVGDKFGLQATNNALNVNAGQIGQYETWTTNNLVGVQFGTEYTHELFFHWLFCSVEGKGGAFVNFADEKNLLFNSGTTYDQRSAHDTQFSSMLDLSVAVSALVGNHLTLRGGYTFLFLDGVALSTDQLDGNPTLSNSREFIADKGTMTLRGPFVGGELAW